MPGEKNHTHESGIRRNIRGEIHKHNCRIRMHVRGQKSQILRWDENNFQGREIKNVKAG